VHYSVYLGLLFAALFGVVGPFVARRVAPAAATWLLSIGGLISGVSGYAAMATLGLTLVGQDSSVAAQGHWSIAALRQVDPVRWPVAVAALTGVALATVRLGIVLARRVRLHRAGLRASRIAAAAAEDLIVLPDLAVEAYALPGRPGRIFITKGMLRLLDTGERHVVIEHERSHLRHRHHLHRGAAAVASALNPLLATLPRTQEWSTERWADEDAARGTARALVASALIKATTLAGGAGRPGGSLAVAGSSVDRRVAAMWRDPPQWRPSMLLAAAGVVTLSVLGTLDALTDTAALFHFAIAAHYTQLGHLRRLLASNP